MGEGGGGDWLLGKGGVMGMMHRWEERAKMYL